MLFTIIVISGLIFHKTTFCFDEKKCRVFYGLKKNYIIISFLCQRFRFVFLRYYISCFINRMFRLWIDRSHSMTAIRFISTSGSSQTCVLSRTQFPPINDCERHAIHHVMAFQPISIGHPGTRAWLSHSTFTRPLIWAPIDWGRSCVEGGHEKRGAGRGRGVRRG